MIPREGGSGKTFCLDIYFDILDASIPRMRGRSPRINKIRVIKIINPMIMKLLKINLVNIINSIKEKKIIIPETHLQLNL